MARRPSKRSSQNRDPEELNLTPIMDMITTIMFFLLIFANVIPLVIINAPLPKIAETAEEIKLAKSSNNKLELIVRITTTGFVVSSGVGSKQFSKGAKGYPYKDFHNFLVALHQRMPKAREITLIPDDGVFYDTIVGVMDASRSLVKGDPGYKAVPPELAEKPEALQFNRLFPDVNLGGV